MRAAVFEGIERLVVKDVPDPVVREQDVLLKVEACAVCGSDIRIFHHGNDRVTPPQILGHEISGRIVQVGSRVSAWKEGDRIAVGADVPCGHCAWCESGRGNACRENYAMGYQFAGGFAEYCLLNEMVMNFGPVHRIPDHVSYEEAALAEPLGCVINGLEIVNIHLGDTLAIIGAGPIGCMMIPVAGLLGATRIIVIEKDKRRLETAKQFGATEYIWTEEQDPVQRVMELTGGQGANVVITANAVSSTHIDAINMAGPRARINLFGGLAAGTTIRLEPNKIHYKEISLMGSHGSTPRQHRMALDLIASGKLDMTRYISQRFPLAEIGKAFAAAENRDGLRVIVNPQL